MDLGELRGMPRGGSKGFIEEASSPPPEQAEDAGRHQKKTKVLTRKHKSRVGEGESRSRSKGKEPAASPEEPEAPAGSEEGGTSPVHERPRGGPEAIAEAEERAFGLREELEKIKGGNAEELLRREASEKGLQAVRGHLGDAQQLLKEAQTRARKMDDELLQTVKDLESARAELPWHAVARYKGSLGFKEGLKQMGRVTYEYGYRVALARFRARYPDANVEEDPFTIHPEDDLVPMERQQDFDDSTPSEP
ncbi:hypothetical protein B296_00051673 [Ensete ventricosum]|uniref:Uncharacterized protein n=1 Tax=Ensete ventricosum TaxID=4639 RepID=A0A426WVD1_ENSVE|nr:hypothetical protein B296_00051673 [Ensete ventricosum]